MTTILNIIGHIANIAIIIMLVLMIYGIGVQATTKELKDLIQGAKKGVDKIKD